MIDNLIFFYLQKILIMSNWVRGQKINKEKTFNNRPSKDKKQKNKNDSTKFQKSKPYKNQQVKNLKPEILAPINSNNNQRIIVPIDENLAKDYIQETKWKEAISSNEFDLSMNHFNEPLIDEYDQRYWIGNIWNGPIMIKNVKPSDNNKSLFKISNKKMYSRNGKDWYNSWKETFTDEEWFLHNESIAENNYIRLRNKYLSSLPYYSDSDSDYESD